MVNTTMAGLWSDLDNWSSIADAIDARHKHDGRSGHAGVCILDNPDTSDRQAMIRCSQALPACDTILSRCLRDEIDDLVTDNAANPISRRALILEGEATFGKTTATMFEVLRRTRAAIDEHGRVIDGTRIRIPWVYVEVGDKYGYRDIAAAILNFIGWPVRGPKTASSLMGELRHALPRFGTEGIVIDDAHNLRGSPDSSRADGLKNLLTGVPASLVFVGLDPMSDSVLLNGAAFGLGTSVQQIARRSTLVRADLGLSEAARRVDWDRLMVSLAGQFHLPGQDGVIAFETPAVRDGLFAVSRGLFGVAYDLLRQSAKDTIRGNVPTFEDAILRRVQLAKPTPLRPSRVTRRTGTRAVSAA